jgi:hypothetical protein
VSNVQQSSSPVNQGIVIFTRTVTWFTFECGTENEGIVGTTFPRCEILKKCVMRGGEPGNFFPPPQARKSYSGQGLIYQRAIGLVGMGHACACALQCIMARDMHA